ncbi:MAG: ATP-binding cassette domain-containing protein [Firmicutes bacterium]|nr:ATP-binding cassette domain-containing protein [Bacillota bacterium]
MSSPLIQAVDWGFRYFDREEYALRHLNLEIEAQEKVLLLGASGSGKSTLLHALAGLLSANSLGEEEGKLLINGLHPLDTQTDVGIVFQDPTTSLVMSRIGDEVAFGLENMGIPKDVIWPRVNAALSEVGLTYPISHYTSALSGGEQQRLVVADLLAAMPSIWLLDEPTANLDPLGARSVIETMFHLHQKTNATVLLIEHRLTELVKLADKVIVLLDKGESVLSGHPEEVFVKHGNFLRKSGIFLPDELVERKRPISFGEATCLEARQISAKHPGQSRMAVSEISLQIKSHHVLSVMGNNGSGKTTLALVLASLLKPTHGQVEFIGVKNGESYFSWRAKELVQHVGMVFQEPEHQFLTSKVIKELLILPKRLKMKPDTAKQKADELLARLGLTHLADCNPFTLSGGEKRRLSVAAALMADPEVLILDEPTFGQDANTFYELVALLSEKTDAGQAVVLITHDVELTSILADRVVSLSKGIIVGENNLDLFVAKRSELNEKFNYGIEKGQTNV